MVLAPVRMSMIAPSQKVVAVEREQHFGWNESKAPSDEQARMDILLKRKADHEKESGLPDVVDSSCWIGQKYPADDAG